MLRRAAKDFYWPSLFPGGTYLCPRVSGAQLLNGSQDESTPGCETRPRVFHHPVHTAFPHFQSDLSPQNTCHSSASSRSMGEEFSFGPRFAATCLTLIIKASYEMAERNGVIRCCSSWFSKSGGRHLSFRSLVGTTTIITKGTPVTDRLDAVL